MRTRIRWGRAASIAALFAVSLLSATGCARVGALTEVRPDGSLTRTVTLRGPAPAPEGGMSLGPKMTDLVDAPGGGAWKVTRATEEMDLVITATREVSGTDAGAGWSDIVVRGEAKKEAQEPDAPASADSAPPAPGPVRVTNRVSVRLIAPGRLEYREVFAWQGKRPDGPGAPDAEMNAVFLKGLPPALARDPAVVKALQRSITREMVKVVFGPGEPIMPLLLFHPEYAEYRLRRRLTGAVRAALAESAAGKLTDAERLAAEKQLTEALTRSISARSRAAQANPASPPAADEKKEEDGGPPVALFVRVKMPGKVISTNGEYDEDTGEVIWPLFAEAAGFEDIVLTAVCEVAK
jgi:Uncharacterized conserved protein